MPPDPDDGHVEAQLVARCRAGDQTAWNELVERFSRYVFAICVQAFRLSEHDAEDVFQDVFMRAYQNLDRLRDDAAIRPWLAQTTRRLCIDRLRAGAREAPADEELEPSGVDETLETLDEALVVHEALAAAPGHCREILDETAPVFRVLFGAADDLVEPEPCERQLLGCANPAFGRWRKAPQQFRQAGFVMGTHAH